MNALVVGAGRMGTFHARVLRDLGYEVTTVDPYAPADRRELPDTPGDYDIAAVATPVEWLGWYTRTLAHAGMRVLIEKPAGADLTQVRQLATNLDGRPVCVGFVERFNPEVQRLRRRMSQIGRPLAARFTRHNDRPSPDIDTDLRIHDVDLAHYLGLITDTHWTPVTYDTRAGMPIRTRIVEVQGERGRITVDLTAHSTSPLHGLWRAFLSGRDYPTLADAVRAHETLNTQEEIAA